MGIQQTNPDVELDSFDEESITFTVTGITARRMLQIIHPDPRPCKLIVSCIALTLTTENCDEDSQAPGADSEPSLFDLCQDVDCRP